MTKAIDYTPSAAKKLKSKFLNKAFKLPAPFKRMIATVAGKDDRDAYRNICLGAALQGMESVESLKKKKSGNIVSVDEE